MTRQAPSRAPRQTPSGGEHYDRSVDVQAHIPQDLQATVVSAVERAAEEHVAQRLREADGTLWGAPQTVEVDNRLGWIGIARRTLGELDELEAFAQEVRAEGTQDVVLLGMGGSSLAPEVLRRSLPARAGWPRLHVLDSTDAGAIRALQDQIDPRHTLFVVSSKSGGTIEPLSMLAHFWEVAHKLGGAAGGGDVWVAGGQPGGLGSDTAAARTAAAAGASATTAGPADAEGGPGGRFIAITDPHTGLERLALERGFRRVFGGDPDIGGRYSALSPFGIVPAALAGHDVRALLDGAAGAWEERLELDAQSVEEMHGLPAPVWIGAALAALARAGRDKLTLVVPEPLAGLGLWEEQLFAESTGKHGTGILPVAGEPLGEPGAYGEDRVFVYMPDTSAPALDHLRAHVLALADAGHPVFEVPLSGPLDLGRAFMLSELAVAVAGWGLGINPFDQPDVQRAKDATNHVLAQFQSSGALPKVPDAGDDELRSVVARASPPSYLAIMGYVQPSAEFDAAVARLRAAVRDATRATTTFGYGPRFLHSTGQFHKGGPRTGRFLQLIHDNPPDIDIPGQPYTFNTLKNAQATGDRATLLDLGLPVARVRLHGEDPAAALHALTDKIKEML